MQNIGRDVVRNLWMAMPPLEEQGRIVGRMAQETAALVNAISRTRHEIDLVREYRTRLIADVVTGKLDVRGFVPPEEISPADPDDADLEENGDEGLGEADEGGLVGEAIDAEG